MKLSPPAVFHKAPCPGILQGLVEREHNPQIVPRGWTSRLHRTTISQLFSLRFTRPSQKLTQKPLHSQKMDIDDILREVDPSSGSIAFETRELQALTRLWVAERSAPELLE